VVTHGSRHATWSGTSRSTRSWPTSPRPAAHASPPAAGPYLLRLAGRAAIYHGETAFGLLLVTVRENGIATLDMHIDPRLFALFVDSELCAR
jgi:hypothetical protein